MCTFRMEGWQESARSSVKRLDRKGGRFAPQYRLEEQDMEDRRFCELTSAQWEAAYALYFTEEESTC